MCEQGKECESYECDVRYDSDRAPYVWLGTKGHDTKFGQLIATLPADERRNFAQRVHKAIQNGYKYIKLAGSSYDICPESYYELEAEHYPEGVDLNEEVVTEAPPRPAYRPRPHSPSPSSFPGHHGKPPRGGAPANSGNDGKPFRRDYNQKIAHKKKHRRDYDDDGGSDY